MYFFVCFLLLYLINDELADIYISYGMDKLVIECLPRTI